jgi:hypothetical protein
MVHHASRYKNNTNKPTAAVDYATVSRVHDASISEVANWPGITPLGI